MWFFSETGMKSDHNGTSEKSEMHVEQTVQWLRAHDITYRPEVLARKQKESQQRKYLGNIRKRVRRAHPDWGVPYPSKLDLACDLIDWAGARG